MIFFKKTIGQILNSKVLKTKDEIALIASDGEYTWQDVSDITNFISKEMMDIGIKKGDYVGIIGKNSESWLFHYLAVVKIGAVAVLLNTRFTGNEIKKCIALTETKFIFYSENNEERSYEEDFHQMLYPNSTVRYYREMERSFQQWQQISAEGNEIKIEPFEDYDAVASVLFTSGTTGNSKGVQLTHYNLLNNSFAMKEKMGWDKSDIMCIAVPLFHTFGITGCVLAMIHASGKMHLLKSTRTIDICKDIEKYKCTIMNGVPTMFLAMLRNEKCKKYNLKSINSGIIAGSQIFPQDYIDICSMFDNINLQPSYGQTETSPCVTICDKDDTMEIKANTVGKVIDGVEVRIMKKDSDEASGCNVEGEIQVKGYNVMKGYVANTQETQEVFTQDGWIKTGDLGYLREDGNLVVTGRFKNLIIRGGENVSPIEIEAAIKEIIGQYEVKVLGIPTVVLQEEIVACIEGENREELKEIIYKRLQENISDYKIPKHIFFMKEIPRNSTGKINEKVLKNKIIAEIGAMA